MGFVEFSHHGEKRKKNGNSENPLVKEDEDAVVLDYYKSLQSRSYK